MQVLLKYPFGKGPLITDSRGLQRVLAMLKNGLDTYVVFYDMIKSETYIERVKDKFGNAFASANLSALETEEEHNMVLLFCVQEGIIKSV